MLNLFNKGIRVIFTLMMAVILILILFFSATEYMCKKEFIYNNIILLTIAFILIAVLWIIRTVLIKNGNKIKPPPYRKIVLFSAVCLFVWQMYLSYNIFFLAGWDAGTVYKAAKTVAFGDVSTLNNSYFSTYPNNLFLATAYSIILKLNRAVGIFPAEQQMLSLIIVNCLCSTASCVLIFKILCRLLNEKYAFLGFWLGVIAFGLSPWVTVCYSDSAGLIFPILLFWLYIKATDGGGHKILRIAALILAGVTGYSIKPQTIIIIMAAVAADSVYMLKRGNHRAVAVKGALLLVCLLSASVLSHGFDRLYEKEGFVINDEAAYGMSHFFMMGLNESRNGVFAEEDTLFSKSFNTKAERRSANWEVSTDRLKNFGIFGYGKHLAKKILVTYNDGTFAWGQEGTFFKKYYDNVNAKASPFLRNIYYPEGKYYRIWTTFSQTIWLMILALCLISGCFFKRKGSERISVILCLAIIGLTMFELLFECRARYLYTYVPVFCIIAVSGVYALMQNTVKLQSRINNKFYIKICKNKEADKLCR